MEQILINGRKYTFVIDFRDNEILRKSYNLLTHKTYGFDFEQWYQSGYWGETYIPYSLMHGEKIVANVSASIMNFMVLGEDKTFIQIGTVMTDPEYCNMGLSRYLMERVIEEWQDKCDLIYLFANDRVLDFYPKFGFKSASEFQYSKSVENYNESITAENLDMTLECNRKLLVEKVKNSVPLSRLAMLRNVGLITFYCTSFMSDKVYYLKDLDAIAVAEFNDDTLYLQDLISDTEINLDLAISQLSNINVKKIVLGFAPNDVEGYSVNLLKEENTTLFVLKDKEDLISSNKLMFPVLSHA
jgi:GNAT superfamily N-acetyltransferase